MRVVKLWSDHTTGHTVRCVEHDKDTVPGHRTTRVVDTVRGQSIDQVIQCLHIPGLIILSPRETLDGILLPDVVKQPLNVLVRIAGVSVVTILCLVKEFQERVFRLQFPEVVICDPSVVPDKQNLLEVTCRGLKLMVLQVHGIIFARVKAIIQGPGNYN